MNIFATWQSHQRKTVDTSPEAKITMKIQPTPPKVTSLAQVYKAPALVSGHQLGGLVKSDPDTMKTGKSDT